MTLAPEFSVASDRVDDQVVVTVRGSVDCAVTPLLHRALDDLIDGDAHQSLVVDLEGLTFIDSKGVHALVQALKRVRSRGGSLHLRGVNHGEHKALDVCGLTSVFSADGP